MGLIDKVNVEVNGSGNLLSTLSTYTTKVLKPNIIDGKNILTQAMISSKNTKYVIKYDYELVEGITVPKNSILEFDGGTLSNGTIIGQDTYINDVGGIGVETLFGDGITREGTWRMDEGGGSVEQVQSDWAQNDSTKKDFIKNKPVIPQVPEIDYKPTAGSDNLVTSGGVYAAINDIANVEEGSGRTNMPHDDYYWSSVHALNSGDTITVSPKHITENQVRWAHFPNTATVIGAGFTYKATDDGENVIVGFPSIDDYDYVITRKDSIVNSAVSYKVGQNLSSEQKAMARQNIGIYGEDFGNDKEYNSAKFSGLGKVYLKKNIVKIDGVEKNILTQNAFYKEGTQTPNTDTVFVVQYDFDLGGAEIQMPADCALDFEGGSFVNGRVNSNGTILEGLFNSSIDNLCGVYYNTNKNALGWDKNEIKDWSFIKTFGTLHTDVIENRYLAVLQSMAIDEDYIYLFFMTSTGTDSAICTLYDRNYNMRGWSTIDGVCHANDAVIHSGYLYLARSSELGLYKINVSTLRNNCLSDSHPNTTPEIILENQSIISIDYDAITNTFCTIESGCTLHFYNENFEQIDTYNANLQTLIQNKTGRDVTMQGMVCKNGILYIISGDFRAGGELSPSAVITTFDIPTKSVINVQPVYNEYVTNEIQGVCIDPVTGLIYGVCDSTGNEGGIVSAFTVGYYSYINAIVDNGSKMLIKDNNRLWNRAIQNKIYVDNNYTGKSNGSLHQPYKTIGEALVLSSGNTRYVLILKNSSKPYYCGSITVMNASLAIQSENNNKVTVNSTIRVQNGTLQVSNIDFVKTVSVINNLKSVILCFPASFVELSNVSINFSNTNDIYGVYSSSAELRIMSLSVTDNSQVVETEVQKMEKSGIYLTNTKAFINSLSATNINAIEANNYAGLVNVQNITLNNSKGVVRSGIYDYNDIVFKGTKTLEELNKLKTIASKSSSQSFSFLQKQGIALENGSMFVLGRYFCDAGTLRKENDPSYRDVQGIYGPSRGIPTSTGVGIPGASYFDTDRGYPIFWDGVKWVDAFGVNINNKLPTDGINMLEKSAIIVVRSDDSLVDGEWAQTQSDVQHSVSITRVDTSIDLYPSITGGIRMGSDTYTVEAKYPLSYIQNGTYTFSFFVKGEGTVYAGVGNNGRYINAFNMSINSENYILYKCLFDIPEDYTQDTTQLYVKTAPGSDIIFCAPKFEKGGIYTGWNKNPEDE